MLRAWSANREEGKESVNRSRQSNVNRDMKHRLSCSILIRLLRLSLPLVSALAATTVYGEWREAVGPPGGMVTAAAIDPCNADSIFLAAQRLYHSSDNGESWKPVKDFPYDALQGGVQSITISRDKDGPILIPGKRLVVSTDRGKTWETRDPLPDASRFYAGAEESRVLYAASGRVIYRSDDNGATWNQLKAWKNDVTGTPGEGWIESFVADRYDADTISFVHRSAEQIHWVLSRDGGRTFAALDVPQDAQTVLSVSTDPDDPGLLYVCVRAGHRAGEERRFLFSYDDGQSWELFWDPASDNVVQEATRKKLEQTFPEMIGLSLPGPWRQLITRDRCAWSENVPGRILAWSWQSILYGSDDFGTTWKPACERLVMTQVRLVAFDPKESKTAYCWGERGAWLTADGGATWADLGIGQYWFFRQIAFSPDGETIFVVADAVYRRTRGDVEWETVWRSQDHSKPPMALFFHKTDEPGATPGSAVVLVGAGLRVESADGGKTWGETGESNLSLNQAPWPKRFVDLTVDGRTRWLAFEQQTPILCSDDEGRTWNPLGPRDGLRADSWSRAADGAFWIVRKGSVRISRPLDQDPPAEADLEIVHPRLVACDPADAKTAYLSDRNNCILRTTDGGKSFQLLEGGPGEFHINDLAVSPHDGALWVATAGNGIWILDKPKEQRGRPLSE
jgi:photosystem II stability/assembly factor-like uncharacterized protein